MPNLSMSIFGSRHFLEERFRGLVLVRFLSNNKLIFAMFNSFKGHELVTNYRLILQVLLVIKMVNSRVYDAR